jgi:hypothetical protein
MRAGHMVANANLGEEAMEFLVFTSQVCLDYYDLLIKEALHKVLKPNKFLKDLIFEFEGINPRKFTIVIDETHIVLFFH